MMQILTSFAKSTSGNSFRSRSDMRQSRHVCSATLSCSPVDVYAVRVVLLSRSADRRKSRIPVRSDESILAQNPESLVIFPWVPTAHPARGDANPTDQ